MRTVLKMKGTGPGRRQAAGASGEQVVRPRHFDASQPVGQMGGSRGEWQGTTLGQHLAAHGAWMAGSWGTESRKEGSADAVGGEWGEMRSDVHKTVGSPPGPSFSRGDRAHVLRQGSNLSRPQESRTPSRSRRMRSCSAPWWQCP